MGSEAIYIGKYIRRIVFFYQFDAQILYFNIFILLLYDGDRGSTVVKALCYKSEGRCFDPSWCHWNFSLT